MDIISSLFGLGIRIFHTFDLTFAVIIKSIAVWMHIPKLEDDNFWIN